MGYFIVSGICCYQNVEVNLIIVDIFVVVVSIIYGVGLVKFKGDFEWRKEGVKIYVSGVVNCVFKELL